MLGSILPYLTTEWRISWLGETVGCISHCWAALIYIGKHIPVVDNLLLLLGDLYSKGDYITYVLGKVPCFKSASVTSRHIPISSLINTSIYIPCWSYAFLVCQGIFYIYYALVKSTWTLWLGVETSMVKYLDIQANIFRIIIESPRIRSEVQTVSKLVGIRSVWRK